MVKALGEKRQIAQRKKDDAKALEEKMEKLKVSQDKDMTSAFDAGDDEDVVF
jgi:hypothetical protein